MIVSSEVFEKATKTRASALEFAAENGLTLEGESAAEIKQSLASQLHIEKQMSSTKEVINDKLADSDLSKRVNDRVESLMNGLIFEEKEHSVYSINNLAGDVIFKTNKPELTVIINGETFTEKANDGLVFVSTGKPFGAYPSIEYVK